MNQDVRLQWQRLEKVNTEVYPDSFSHVVWPNPFNTAQELPFPEPQAVAEPCMLYGDNLIWMNTLLQEGKAGSIDLIYIDPPYMSDVSYNSVLEKEAEQFRRPAFSDRWERGMPAYLNMLFPRLVRMRELLSPQGSLFIHLDWHASHYVKVLLDELFGYQNFVNEIVWCYGGGSRARRRFQRKHDLIFWYARGKNYTFNPQYRPYTPATRERGLTQVKGDKYKLREEGAMMQDWWTDIPKILSPTAYENLKYPTQKPKDLLTRIIRSASNEGDLVADFYAGSGTTAEACEELERRWLLCDNSPIALQTASYRQLRKKTSAFKIIRPQPYEKAAKSSIQAKKIKNNTMMEIEIQNYTPPEGETEQNPESVIDYWELDPCYDGKTFQSRWQLIRSKKNLQEPLPLKIQIPIENSHQVAVVVHDIYGKSVLCCCRVE
ncbi:MAG TPA: site-specific DNA-methyltransferase [Syntrophomonadaceae bacterium]|nr:site-specific DNA-methyltransferase [Syntrophomonadaceae bacterium]